MQPTKLKLQSLIAIIAVLLFALKILAWYITKSISIYTDAVESLVNVVAGFIGLYSVWLASKPSDENHPYGHGKVEYISAAIEGTLIIIAGVVILIEAVQRYFNPQPIEDMNTGLWLIAATALVNGLLGFYAIKFGKKHYSIAIESSGKHLLSDTYSTVGILSGLVIIKFTNFYILDTIIASIMGIFITYSGYTVIRKSLAGIMDEANMDLLQRILQFVNSERKEDWIDLHNLRAIQYGTILHIDAHVTVPWYYDVKKSHNTITEMENSIKLQFENAVEFFIHTDACTEKSCSLCVLLDCPVRAAAFEKKIDWNLQNVLKNKQHILL